MQQMSPEALEAGFQQSLAQSSKSEISESLGAMLAELHHNMGAGIKHDPAILGMVHILYQACSPEDQKRHLPTIEKLTKQFEKSQYQSFNYLDQLRQLQPESSRNARAIEAPLSTTEQAPASTKSDAQKAKARERKKRQAANKKAALQVLQEQTKQAQLETAKAQAELEKIKRSVQQTKQKLVALQRQKKAATSTASSTERAVNPFRPPSGTQINHTTATAGRPASRTSTATANPYRGKQALENWGQLTPKDKRMIYGMREKSHQNAQQIKELTGIIETLREQLRPFTEGQIQDVSTHEELTTQLSTAQQLLQEAHEPGLVVQPHSTTLKPTSPRLLSRSMNNISELADEQPEVEYSETEADNPEGSPLRKILSFSDMRSLQKPGMTFP